MEQSSSFIQHQPFQLYLLRCKFQLDKLHQNDDEKDAGTEGRRKKCSKIQSAASSPIASKSPGILIATGKPESKMRRNLKSDAASSSQVRLQDAYLGGLMDTATGKLVATKEESEYVDLSESETWSFQEEAVTERPINLMYPVNQTTREVPKLKKRMVTQSTRVSSHSSPYGSSLLDRQEDLRVNMAIWGIFLNTTLRAAVHLGQDYEANLRYAKNHLWNCVGQLFNENEKLISGQIEITGVSTVNFKELTWMAISLLCSRAYQITIAKTYVFSDSVLCVGKWEMILLQPGRAKLNGVRKTITSRI